MLATADSILSTNTSYSGGNYVGTRQLPIIEKCELLLCSESFTVFGGGCHMVRRPRQPSYSSTPPVFMVN